MLENAALAHDERFAGNAARVDNRSALHEEIRAILGTLDTGVAVARLDAAAIANAELRDMHGFSAHPQLTARNRWRDVASPVGPLRSLIPPVTARETEYVMGSVPALGEHTGKVLAELGIPVDVHDQ